MSCSSARGPSAAKTVAGMMGQHTSCVSGRIQNELDKYSLMLAGVQSYIANYGIDITQRSQLAEVLFGPGLSGSGF